MAKGSDFEREICRMLSLWWTENQRDDIFWRTAGSGARATVRSRKGVKTANSHGDIGALDPIGQPFLDVFAVEIKRGYSDATPYDAFDCPAKAKQKKWEAFIEQARLAMAGCESLAWMLITRRDRRAPCVCIPSYMKSLLKPYQNKGAALAYGLYVRIPDRRPRSDLTSIGASEAYWIFRLDEFLVAVKPDHIRDINEKNRPLAAG